MNYQKIILSQIQVGSHCMKASRIVIRGSLLGSVRNLGFPSEPFILCLSPPGLHSHNGDSRRPNLVSDSKRVWSFVLGSGCRKTYFTLVCQASRKYGIEI